MDNLISNSLLALIYLLILELSLNLKVKWHSEVEFLLGRMESIGFFSYFNDKFLESRSIHVAL